jgi:hypothetical protein
MPTEIDPIVGNWYCHLDKGQRFQVVAVNESRQLVEMQDFDGTLSESDFDSWYEMDLEVCAEPENWVGSQDIGEADDYGTEITDTEDSDWTEPADDFQPASGRQE